MPSGTNRVGSYVSCPLNSKFNEAPKISKSMKIALNDLKLEHLWVIYPGKVVFPMEDQITAWPLIRPFEPTEFKAN